MAKHGNQVKPFPTVQDPSLKHWEGTISCIPKQHVGIIEFQIKGRKSTAFFFPTSYFNGKEKLSQLDPLNRYVKVGDTVFFDAIENHQENSYQINWKAIRVWKGQPPHSKQTSIKSTNINCIGTISHLSEREGLIAFSLSGVQEKCFFTCVAILNDEEKQADEIDLKLYTSVGEKVKFSAHPKLGKCRNYSYSWEADQVQINYENSLLSYEDSCKTECRIEEKHEEGDWHCVEGKKGAIHKKKTDMCSGDCKSGAKKFPQQMLSDKIGEVLEVNSVRAVIGFVHDGNKERALLISDKFHPQCKGTLKDIMTEGDKIHFTCHLYDKPDRPDKCKWFIIEGWKDPKYEAVCGIGHDMYYTEGKTELKRTANQTGVLQELNQHSGVILYKPDKNSSLTQKVFFWNTDVYFGSKMLGKTVNLALTFTNGETVNFDAVQCPRKSEYDWKATHVWKGEKYTSYGAALKSRNKTRSISECSDYSGGKGSHIDDLLDSDTFPSTYKLEQEIKSQSNIGSPGFQNNESNDYPYTYYSPTSNFGTLEGMYSKVNSDLASMNKPENVIKPPHSVSSCYYNMPMFSATEDGLKFSVNGTEPTKNQFSHYMNSNSMPGGSVSGSVPFSSQNPNSCPPGVWHSSDFSQPHLSPPSIMAGSPNSNNLSKDDMINCLLITSQRLFDFIYKNFSQFSLEPSLIDCYSVFSLIKDAHTKSNTNYHSLNVDLLGTSPFGNSLPAFNLRRESTDSSMSVNVSTNSRPASRTALPAGYSEAGLKKLVKSAYSTQNADLLSPISSEYHSDLVNTTNGQARNQSVSASCEDRLENLRINGNHISKLPGQILENTDKMINLENGTNIFQNSDLSGHIDGIENMNFKPQQGANCSEFEASEVKAG